MNGPAMMAGSISSQWASRTTNNEVPRLHSRSTDLAIPTRHQRFPKTLGQINRERWAILRWISGRYGPEKVDEIFSRLRRIGITRFRDLFKEYDPKLGIYVVDDEAVRILTADHVQAFTHDGESVFMQRSVVSKIRNDPKDLESKLVYEHEQKHVKHSQFHGIAGKKRALTLDQFLTQELYAHIDAFIDIYGKNELRRPYFGHETYMDFFLTSMRQHIHHQTAAGGRTFEEYSVPDILARLGLAVDFTLQMLSEGKENQVRALLLSASRLDHILAYIPQHQYTQWTQNFLPINRASEIRTKLAQWQTDWLRGNRHPIEPDFR
jgi:hypothetical protein